MAPCPSSPGLYGECYWSNCSRRHINTVVNCCWGERVFTYCGRNAHCPHCYTCKNTWQRGNVHGAALGMKLLVACSNSWYPRSLWLHARNGKRNEWRWDEIQGERKKSKSRIQKKEVINNEISTISYFLFHKFLDWLLKTQEIITVK